MSLIYVGNDIGSTSTRTAVITDSRDFIRETSNYVVQYSPEHGDPSRKVSESASFEETLFVDIKIETEKPQIHPEIDAVVSRINNQKWLLGDIATNIATRPTQLSPGKRKSIQPHAYLNIISSTISWMKALGFNEVDTYFRTLLPPTEYQHAEFGPLIPRTLEGAKIKVTNLLTNEVFKINVRGADARPEGLAAVSSCMVDEHGNETELASSIETTLQILIDIGENTTDVVPILRGKPVTGKMATIGRGAKYTMSKLGALISDQYNFRPSMTDLRNAYNNGKLFIGNDNTDIQSLISTANKEFNMLLVDEMDINYLIQHNYDYHSINGFIFVGGGSIKSGPATISVPDHYKAHVRSVVDGIPFHSPSDVRMANIQGTRLQLVRMRNLQLANTQI